MVLMIDNYDSFTFNLVQYLQTLGAEVKVVRNDELSVAQIEALAPERIVISPGPCTPNEAGVSVDVHRQLGARVPILGVCPGPPEHRPGLRRRRGPRQDDHAWQDFAHPPRRAGRVRRPARWL
jgi:hypothetical protein